ncbi:MAG: hypothetical protein SVT56_06640 [Chloroflexota bacterium]|nr:hypothetical protein [Chloroflexota bacterium]
MPALAARYELKDGEQYALCRDYVAALNAYDYEFPMACERHFPPEFEKFAKPKWTPLEPQSKPKSFYRELYYVWYGRPGYEKATEEGWRSIWENRMKPALDAGRLQLDRARVDIGGMGVRVPLLRFAYRPCQESQEWFEQNPYPETYRYFVIDEKTGQLNKGFARLTSTERGLFYYHGRTYMDSFNGVAIQRMNKPWRKPGDAPGLLTVVEPYGKVREPGKYEFDGNRQVCVVDVYYELPGSEIEGEGRNE